MTRIVGPTGSRRRRRFLLVPLLFVAVAFAVFFVAGAEANLPGSPSTFEANDGNMTLGASGHTDWNCFVNSDNFAHNGATPAGCAATTGASNAPADPNGEVNFQGGAKFDDVCPALSTGNNPPKDEFIDVSSFSDSNSGTGDTFFYGATERTSPNGNTEGAIELDHNKGDGKTQLTCRVSGDRLIEYQFLNGGTSLQFQVVTWIKDLSDTSGGNNTPPFSGCLTKTDNPPCWGAAIITSKSGTFLEGESNQQAIQATDNGINNQFLDINQFAEFGANLTQILGLQGQCVSLPQQVFESKASGSSFTSQPKDVEITNTNIQTCGEVIVRKHTDGRGIDQPFTFSSDIKGGQLKDGTASGVTGATCREAVSGYGGTYTLNDKGNSSSDSAGNTDDCAQVPQGTYNIEEKNIPSNFTLNNIVCSVTGSGGSTVVYQPSGNSTFTAGDTKIVITLKPGDTVDCTYTNKLKVGALDILKNSAKTGKAVKNTGAVFTYTGPDNVPHDVTDNGPGEVCVPGLAIGSYSVTEKSPPTGYAKDTSTQTVTVIAGTNCTDNKPTSASTGQATFTDPPLADVQIRWKDDGSNELSLDSPLSCTTTATHDAADTTNASPWHDTLTIPNIQVTSGSTPNVTITCTVKIDP